MGKFKLIILCVLVAFGTLVVTPTHARGQENQMKTIFIDTFYGMAAGVMIASAISLTQDDPDWGENVGTGAAVGGIAGLLFGIATEVRYMATVEDGRVYVSMPSIGLKITDRVENDTIYTAGIFKYKF